MEPLTLTNSEWYVLDSLWERSPMTVMELVSALHEKVGWAKSTTITTLRRMEDKGLLHCQVEGRTRHYTPAVERQSAARQETRSFLDQCGIDGLLPGPGRSPEPGGSRSAL